MSLGRNACDGRLVASVRIVHAWLRGLIRQRTPFAPSVVSLSTWAPGQVVHIAFHANHWTQRNAGWKLMTLRQKARWSINHRTPGVGRDSFL
jgi:hypothetical protein